MGIMLGGFDRMGEGDSKKMQKLVLKRAKSNQTRDWPYLSQFLDFVMVVAALDSPCHKQSDGHHVGGL